VRQNYLVHKSIPPACSMTHTESTPITSCKAQQRVVE
jgi:hypothetical protein